MSWVRMLHSADQVKHPFFRSSKWAESARSQVLLPTPAIKEELARGFIADAIMMRLFFFSQIELRRGDAAVCNVDVDDAVFVVLAEVMAVAGVHHHPEYRGR